MQRAHPHVQELFRAGKLKKIELDSKNAAIWQQYVYRDADWSKSLFIRAYNSPSAPELKALMGAEAKIPKYMRSYVVMPRAKLSTPSVRVYPLFESNLLEFIQKRQATLRNLPPSQLPMQILLHEREMIDFGSQLESIMRGLHKAGIVHNDWKLENVLVTHGPTDRKVFLADLECATFKPNQEPECYSLVTLDPRFPNYKSKVKYPYMKQEQFSVAQIIYRLMRFETLFIMNWDQQGSVYAWLKRSHAWEQTMARYNETSGTLRTTLRRLIMY